VTAPPDRRARKKAQTRAEVLRTAQRLFAERGFDAVTIADVAAAADVAVQTVFNHFSGKEELFFADRTPWLDGPADAVRTRPAGVPPLAALRGYATELVRTALEEDCTAEGRAVLATLAASPALQAALPTLHRKSERRLAAALAEAWRPAGCTAAAPDGGEEPAPLREVRIAASLTAALWVAAARTLLTELNRLPEDGAGDAGTRAAVEQLAERVFDRLETSLATLLDLPAG
jgi:AcrR family transcriptional regulator